MRDAAFWFVVPFAASVLFGAGAPWVSRRMTPKAAAVLLSAGSLILAGATMAAAGLVVGFVAGETPVAAEHGHWSIRHLEASQPFDARLGVAAIAILSLQALSLVCALARHGRLLGRAWWTSHRASTGLVVIDDPNPTAYAVPGWPGRIVASAGLLETFDAVERRVVLAHEQAHLDGHHDLYLTAAAMAASVNPLLARVPAATALATERWADEAAVVAVGDRRTVAETIVRAATTAPAPAPRMLTFGAAGEHVMQRVMALLDPPAARRPFLAVALGGVVVLSLAAALVSARDTKQLFEAAELAARASGHVR